MKHAGVFQVGFGFLIAGVLWSGVDARAADPEKAPEKAKETAGEIVSLKGRVTVQSEGAAKGGVLKAGDPLRAGDVVNTPADGFAKIMLKDRSIMDLGSLAQFKIDHFQKNSGSDRQVELSVGYGKLRGLVTQKVEGKGRLLIRTKAATMGVRGTEFILKADATDVPGAAKTEAKAPPQTQITVVQGAVEVKNDLAKDTAVQLTAGTQLTARPDEAIAPAKIVKLDTQQLKAAVQEVKVADNTFQKAVVIDASATQGEGSSGAGSEATKAAVASSLAAPAAIAVSAGDASFAGTFGVASSFSQGELGDQPQPRNLRVRVVYK